MYDLTLFRGTTEPWEKACIEAFIPQNTTVIRGRYMTQSLNLNQDYEQIVRNRIQQYPCSVLRSGKDVVCGYNVPPLATMNADQINLEIIKRVGHETALGTPNLDSHFVPCGTNVGISQGFGHGAYYQFHIQGVIIGRTKENIVQYVNDRQAGTYPSYVNPLFMGGNNEVLAYTGTLITSVVLIDSNRVAHVILGSLD